MAPPLMQEGLGSAAMQLVAESYKQLYDKVATRVAALRFPARTPAARASANARVIGSSPVRMSNGEGTRETSETA